MSFPTLDYASDSRPSRLRALARHEPITFWYVAGVLAVNVSLVGFFIIDPPGLAKVVAHVVAPGAQWLLILCGLLLTPTVWKRSNANVFLVHAMLTLLFPWLCRQAVVKLALSLV